MKPEPPSRLSPDAGTKTLSARAAGSVVSTEASGDDSGGRCRVFCRALSLGVIALGAVVLLGWALDIGALKSVLPGWVTMKANTALGFVLAGSSLWLLREEAPSRRGLVVGRVLAGGVAALGLLTLVQDLAGWDLHLDNLLFREEAGAAAIFPPGRMSPATAFNLLLAGLALVDMDRVNKRGQRPAQFLALLVLVVAFLGAVGYLYGISGLFRVGHFTAMAMHTVLGFLALALGILLARPRAGWMLVFSNHGPRGWLARRMIPAIVIFPVSLGWLVLGGERAGLYPGEFSVALLVFVCGAALIAFTWWTAETLHKLDAERQRHQESLAASEARYRAILASIPEKLFLKDRNSVYLSVNEHYAADFKLTPEAFAGKDDYDFYPRELADQYRADDREVMESGRVKEVDERYVVAGQEYWVRTVKAPVRDEAGQMVGLLGLFWDVTTEKKAEAKLRASEARFREIFNLVPVSIWEEDWSEVIAGIRGLREAGVTDFAGHFQEHPEFVQRMLQAVKIVDVNPETLVMFEARDKSEMLRSLQTVFATPDTLPGFAGELLALAAGKHTYRTEMALRTVGGRVVHTLLTMAFPEESARSSAVYVSLMDVTARKSTELALRDANDHLRRSNQDLEQFAYVASHDLQEPLRMVASYTQLLGETYGDKLGGEAGKWIGYAVDGANRMQRLINDLLTFSRVNTRGGRFTPVDSHALLGQALVNLRAALDESGGLVTNDDLPEIHADATQMMQLFQNLIGNALKFRGSEPPRVHVSCRTEREEVVFSVRDNGIGIDPKYADKLFVIFQRLHTRREYPGTGIGLALCKRIVERHGGRIWFESQPGRGTTFSFSLPRNHANSK